MRSILVLTKNLLMEQRLQEQLQRLNYEVYCSADFLNQLLIGNEIEHVFNIYQTIILSETISNHEIQQILANITGEDRAVLRKFNGEPTDKEKEQLKLLGINDYLIEGDSLDQLREQLAEKLAKFENNQPKTMLIHQLKKKTSLKDIKIKFSKMEKKTLQRLIESDGESVSRQEMCEYLWNDEPNNSHLSQLSLLVKRLKNKLEQEGFEDDVIETIWGYGYRLSPKIAHETNKNSEIQSTEEMELVAEEC